MPVIRIGLRRSLSFPRRLTVGVLRAMEAAALNLAGRRWKIDRFNRLTERDVRETADRLRAISAKTIVVQGTVDGSLTASDRLDLRKSAVVTGDVTTQRIAIEEGAFLKGKVDIQREAGKGASS